MHSAAKCAVESESSQTHTRIQTLSLPLLFYMIHSDDFKNTNRKEDVLRVVRFSSAVPENGRKMQLSGRSHAGAVTL